MINISKNNKRGFAIMESLLMIAAMGFLIYISGSHINSTVKIKNKISINEELVGSLNKEIIRLSNEEWTNLDGEIASYEVHEDKYTLSFRYEKDEEKNIETLFISPRDLPIKEDFRLDRYVKINKGQGE